MRTTAYLAFAALLMFAIAAPAVAQQPVEEPADLKAYRPIFDTKNPALAETFLAESSQVFLDSQYRDNVYLILYRAYKDEKNWDRALNTVDRLEKLVPKTPPERRALFYAEAMDIAANMIKPPDPKRTIMYAEKILAIDAKHVNALLTLATAIPANATEAELNKIIEYGKRVLELPKPADVPNDDQWQQIRNEIQLNNQSLIAIMIFNKQDWNGCIRAYEEVIRLSPKDSTGWYRLGICHYQLVTNDLKVLQTANATHRDFIVECNKKGEEDHVGCETDENKAKIAELKAKEDEAKKDFEARRDKAIDILAKAAATGDSPSAASARVELEKLYKNKSPNQNLDGLEDLIKEKKKELGGV